MIGQDINNQTFKENMAGMPSESHDLSAMSGIGIANEHPMVQEQF